MKKVKLNLDDFSAKSLSREHFLKIQGGSEINDEGIVVVIIGNIKNPSTGSGAGSGLPPDGSSVPLEEV